MAYNEQLVAEITRRVISALQSAQQPETENHPVSAAESPKGYCGRHRRRRLKAPVYPGS